MHEGIPTAACCLLAVLLNSSSPSAQATEAIIERSYQILGDASLRLRVPQTWRVAERSDPDKGVKTISFRPSGGSPSAVLITVVPSELVGWRISDEEELRRRVEATAKDVGSQAIEMNPSLRELKGTFGRGFYFSATDPAPPPGEYEFMTQGMLPLRGVLLTFTIFTNEGRADVVEKALRLIASASDDGPR